MDKIKGGLNKNERVLFNRCRIYLKVCLVSDITTADGRYISWYAAQGLEDSTQPSKWKWPKQGRPPRHAWEMWQKGIHLLGSQDRSGRIQLHQKLGKWKLEDDTGWLLDATSDRLLNQKTGQIYIKKTGRPTRYAKSLFKPWTGIDENFRGEQRANVILQPNGDVHMESTFTRELLQPLSSITKFQAYVRQNRHWDWWAAARAEWKGSVIQWKDKYIPGHQSVFEKQL
jgi:hypothetical protein